METKDIEYYMNDLESELKEKIINLYGDKDINIDGELLEELIGYTEKRLESNKYIITLEDEYGGEGMGDEYWMVFKVTNKGTNEFVFIKFEGVYNSWDGVEWDGGLTKLVSPVEKVVIVYE